MWFIGNGYDSSYIRQGYTVPPSPSFCEDVPEYYSSYFELLITETYKRYLVVAALNPPFLFPLEQQFDQMKKANKYLLDDEDALILFGEMLDFDWISEVKKGGVKKGCNECYLKKAFLKFEKKNNQLKKREAAGVRIYGIRIAPYEFFYDCLRWIRNLYEHPQPEYGFVDFQSFLDSLNRQNLNLPWKIFVALLETSISLPIESRETFLQEVGLIPSRTN